MKAAKPTTAARDAERRVQREYEPLKPDALRSLSSKLRARGIDLPDGDLEEYYNQAWHALYVQAASGTEIENAGGFIVQVAFRRAIDDLRRLRPDERVDFPLEHVAAVQPDAVDRLEDQRRLREFVEALRDEFDDRERVAASLCYIHGYTRPEAATLIGIGERRMQKVMDAVSKSITRITREIQAGQRCDSRGSVNKAYALGLLDTAGERYVAARAHLDECARCRADVLGLRGLAIVAPAPLLPFAVAGTVGGVGFAKRRRPPRSNALAAGAAAAVVVLAVLAAFALSRGSSDPERRDGSARSASVPGPSSPASGASPATKRDRERDASPAPAASLAAKAKRERDPSSTPRRRAPRRRSAPMPVATVAPPVPTPAPVPVSTPAAPTPVPVGTPAAPTPTPTAAQPEPPVLDDGVQEFGVEP